jgi:hypothetical protein
MIHGGWVRRHLKLWLQRQQVGCLHWWHGCQFSSIRFLAQIHLGLTEQVPLWRSSMEH